MHVGADARPTRQPSKPEAPSLPWPATTRPSGIAPGSSSVRPAWFSKPATVVGDAVAELALEQDVADHAPSPATVSSGKRPAPGIHDAVVAAVAAPEQLVAAADREQRRAACRPPRAAPSPARGEIRRDERLLAILAAADVDRGRRAAARAPRRARPPVTSSSCPRSAARRASTAMLPRSA